MYIICYGIEYFLLCEGMVICDVIDITRGFVMISGQQEALHYIGYVAKWQRIVSSPNNYALAILHALSNAAKV